MAYNPAGQVLSPPAGAGAQPVILETEDDVRTWLPGVVDVDAEVTLPASMGSGAWEVSVGIAGTPME